MAEDISTISESNSALIYHYYHSIPEHKGETWPALREWSKEVMTYRRGLLEQMSQEEVEYILSRTQGPLRLWVSQYLIKHAKRGEVDDQ